MGGALAHGLLKGSIFKPSDITVANPHEGKLKPFAELGASITTSNTAAVMGADYVAIVVKPWLVKQVAEELKEVMDYDKQTVLNLAASLTFDQLHAWFGLNDTYPPIAQIAPNLAIAQRASMTFIAPDAQAAAKADELKKIFDDLGTAIVTDERHIPAGVAMAGCGIAYAMRYIRAAAEGGVELGFDAKSATSIVMQTLKGAVAMLQASGLHPEAAIDKVTTPGGLTIKGLNAMERERFTNAVISGLRASM